MLSSLVVPAVIPSTQDSVSDFVQSLGSIPEIHLDVVDGAFVPFVSWPHEPQGSPQVLRDLLAPYTLEVDLMVADPLAAAKAWLLAGADMLVFHVESISLASFAAFVETTPVTVGIAALNDTPYEVLAPYAAIADYVQVMGIAQIGAQGQPFDDRAYGRVTQLRTDFPDLMLSLDGSVNMVTLPQLKALALDRYIVGSAIAKAKQPRQAYDSFVRALSSTGV